MWFMNDGPLSLLLLLILSHGIPTWSIDCVQCIPVGQETCVSTPASPCNASADSCYASVTNKDKIGVKECVIFDASSMQEGCKEDVIQNSECVCKKDGCNKGDASEVKLAAGGSSGNGSMQNGKGSSSGVLDIIRISKTFWCTALLLIIISTK